MDSGQPVTACMTLDALLTEDEFATPRFNLILLVGVRRDRLVLAVVGVYGVMSSAVAQEKQEIGIRMALGADAGTIARMVIVRGSRLLFAGMIVGLAGSVAAGRMLAQQIWRVSAFDPIAFTLRVGSAADRRSSGVRLARAARRAHRSDRRAAPGLNMRDLGD